MTTPGTKVAIMFSGQPTPNEEALLRGLFESVAREVVIVGGLDGVTPTELRAMIPADGDPRIMTELADGATVVVDRAALTSRLEKRMDALVADGCGLVVCLTTCVCPRPTPGAVTLFATPVLEAIVRAMLAPGSRLGLVVPLASQYAHIGSFWASRGYEPTCAAADPWADLSVIDEAAARLAPIRAPLVVMDCFGYSREHRERLRRSVGGLVLLPQEVLISLALQLLG
jgi:protein AroM